MKLILTILSVFMSFNLCAQVINLEFLETVQKEGDEAGALYTAKITLSEKVDKEVKVSYSTQDGQAKAGIDYTAAQGDIVFKPNETTKIVQVVAIADKKAEKYLKQFDFILSNPVGATLGKDYEVLTIKEDDVEISLEGRPQVKEGDKGETSTMSFNISMKYEFGETILIGYETLASEGSATEGQDYQSVYSTIAFKSGETQKSFSVTINGDDKLEPNEDFFVEIWSNDERVTISNSKTDGYIIDDEGNPYFSFKLKARDYYKGELFESGDSEGEVALEKKTDNNGNTFYQAWWTPWEYTTFSKHTELRDLKGRYRVKFYSDDGSFSAESMVVEWAVDGPYCELVISPIKIACPWMTVIFSAHEDNFQRGAYILDRFQEVNSGGANGVTLAKQKKTYSNAENETTYEATYKILRKE